MLLSSDVIAVLGGQFGIGVDILKKHSYLMRSEYYTEYPVRLSCGIRYSNGRCRTLPLRAGKELFDHAALSSSPSRIVILGEDSACGACVSLEIITPFKPRDEVFSTVPGLLFRLSVRNMTDEPMEGEVFFEIAGDGLTVAPGKGKLSVSYRAKTDASVCYHDAIVPMKGIVSDSGLVAPFAVEGGAKLQAMLFAWCTFQPVSPMVILGEPCVFRYDENLSSLDSVAAWMSRNHAAVLENADKVDEQLAASHEGAHFRAVLSSALHAFLMNSWFLTAKNNQKWFLFWEHPSMDLSSVTACYGQIPFYLTVWPELLEYQLNQYPYCMARGETVLGEDGLGTAYIPGKAGSFYHCRPATKPKATALRSTAIYLLMFYCHLKWTDNEKPLWKHRRLVKMLMDFTVKYLNAYFKRPDGAPPVVGIEDQHGEGNATDRLVNCVVGLAALECGVKLLEHAEIEYEGEVYTAMIRRMRGELVRRYWRGSHFACCDETCASGADSHQIYLSALMGPLCFVGEDGLIDENYIRMDIETTYMNAGTPFGTRSVYTDAKHRMDAGRISLNILRDIAAACLGDDLSGQMGNYLLWLRHMECKGMRCYNDSFPHGDAPMSPRGVAAFGLPHALTRGKLLRRPPFSVGEKG